MAGFDAEQDVCRINLMQETEPVAPPAPAPEANPESGPPAPIESTVVALPTAPLPRMTIGELRRNYDAILAAGAIYYPVSYQFQRKLGQGRQGAVMLGLRQGARGCITEHAIKLFDPSIYRTPEEYWTDMGRIASQVSRLQRVQSPNLVTRHTYEETYGIGYLQMEAIDGVDLEAFVRPDHLDVVRRRSTPWEWSHFTRAIFRLAPEGLRVQPGVTVYILRMILRGLERLHGSRFVHHDVKPANIMIDRLGNVKIVDFGRAVVAGEQLSFLLGSPRYMAPEMHRREPADPRSDLYSLGLVAIEMLSGKPLAPSETTESDLLAYKLRLPRILGDLLPPEVVSNRELFAILGRLIAPDQAARFGGARDADSGRHGLAVVEKQLVQVGLDSQYERDLAAYLAKLIDPRTQRVELPDRRELEGPSAP